MTDTQEPVKRGRKRKFTDGQFIETFHRVKNIPELMEILGIAQVTAYKTLARLKKEGHVLPDKRPNRKAMTLGDTLHTIPFSQATQIEYKTIRVERRYYGLVPIKIVAVKMLFAYVGLSYLHHVAEKYDVSLLTAKKHILSAMKYFHETPHDKWHPTLIHSMPSWAVNNAAYNDYMRPRNLHEVKMVHAIAQDISIFDDPERLSKSTATSLNRVNTYLTDCFKWLQLPPEERRIKKEKVEEVVYIDEPTVTEIEPYPVDTLPDPPVDPVDPSQSPPSDQSNNIEEEIENEEELDPEPPEPPKPVRNNKAMWELLRQRHEARKKQSKEVK